MQALRHVRPIKPLRFPSSNSDWDMAQSPRHHRLCELLYQVLSQAAGPTSSVGCDQFVYYDASSPRRCLAPDGFVKLGVVNHLPDTWRTWELGTPELCVEILSPSDSEEKLTFAEKLRRYTALGTRELIVFNTDAKRGRRIRAWDRIEGDFAERVVSQERTPCVALPGLSFALVADPKLGDALRLVDANGKPIPTEVERLEALADGLRKERDAALAERDRARATSRERTRRSRKR